MSGVSSIIQASDTLGKIQSISQQIVSKLNRDCQCVIDAAYITAAQLSCDPQGTTHVIYRARLSSIPRVSSTDLISLLEEWVTSGSASVTLEFIQLSLDPACGVMITSFSDPLCPAVTLEQPNTPTVTVVESSTTTVYIIAGLAAVILAGVILIVVCACAVLIYRSKFSKYSVRSVKYYYHYHKICFLFTVHLHGRVKISSCCY